MSVAKMDDAEGQYDYHYNVTPTDSRRWARHDSLVSYQSLLTEGIHDLKVIVKNLNVQCKCKTLENALLQDPTVPLRTRIEAIKNMIAATLKESGVTLKRKLEVHLRISCCDLEKNDQKRSGTYSTSIRTSMRMGGELQHRKVLYLSLIIVSHLRDSLTVDDQKGRPMENSGCKIARR